jgi:membrane protein
MRSMFARAFRLVVDAYDRYDRHGDLLAGSLAFFALLSLAPLIVIAVSVASLLIEPGQARAGLLSALREVASPDIVSELVQLVDAIDQQQSGVGAVIAGFLLLYAASRFFLQVEQAINLVWGVARPPALNNRERLYRFIMKRLISFAMVLVCGVLLISMLLVQAVLAMIGSAVSEVIGAGLAALGPPIVFLVLLTLLLTLMFRVLPDTEVRFREVWVGAATTALLVLLGTWLLGLYLTKIAPAWLQGAAGALAAFMVWIYYLAQVFLLGASFTRAWAVRDRKSKVNDG